MFVIIRDATVSFAKTTWGMWSMEQATTKGWTELPAMRVINIVAYPACFSTYRPTINER